MASPLSLDLRSRVVRAVEEGMTRPAAADRFGVAIRTAVRWVRAFRSSGSLAPQKMGNPSPPKLTAHRETVLAMLGRGEPNGDGAAVITVRVSEMVGDAAGGQRRKHEDANRLFG
jgi:transposase